MRFCARSRPPGTITPRVDLGSRPDRRVRKIAQTPCRIAAPRWAILHTLRAILISMPLIVAAMAGFGPSPTDRPGRRRADTPIFISGPFQRSGADHGQYSYLVIFLQFISITCRRVDEIMGTFGTPGGPLVWDGLLVPGAEAVAATRPAQMTALKRGRFLRMTVRRAPRLSGAHRGLGRGRCPAASVARGSRLATEHCHHGEKPLVAGASAL